MSNHWSVERAAGSPLIVLTYAGDLPAEFGDLASRRFVELVGTDSVTLCADFTELKSYEPEVRHAWQRNVFPIRKQVSGIYMATTNMLVKMGVAAFGLFIGVRPHYLRTRAELDQVIATATLSRPQT
jgi:hypothetical protein